jgi:DedD protein
MEEGLKRRLIGAAVLASLAVIFVPMLFEEPPSQPPPLPPLPSKPPEVDFASQMLREEVPAVTPLAPREPAPEPTPPAAPPEPAPVAAAEPAPAPAPEPAPERTEPPTGLAAWVIQAASLSSQENADRLVARLREADLPTPDPELVDIKGKRFYRVRVGPVVERAEAEAMLGRVSEIAGTRAQVQQYP